MIFSRFNHKLEKKSLSMMFRKLRFSGRTEWVLISIAIISFIIAVIQVSNYNEAAPYESSEETFLHSALIAGAGSGSLVHAQKSERTKSILLPAGFNIPEDLVRNHLKDTASSEWPISQLLSREVLNQPPGEESHYRTHEPFSMYQESEEGDCEEDLKHIIEDLEISPREIIPGNFTRILEIVIEEHDKYKDPFYKYIRPILITHIRAEFEANLVNRFWYRLSGSSVWLKDYNVHFVVSRFMFADKGERSTPKASFVLAQVFDKNWHELQDVRLVFPTNDLGGEEDPTFHSEGQTFSSYRFPRILPVPFDFHADERNMGPEDPRLILVRNKNGHDEPVAIFNSHYDKFETKEDGTKESNAFRSMFMAFPFQLTKGKRHLPELSDENTDKLYFTKSLELEIEHHEKPKTCKNWSPMVSDFEREVNGGFDTSISFATNLENLEIVRCSLDTGKCGRLYKKSGDNIGPLRGGTAFVNLNSILKQQRHIPLHKLLPPGREVYFAFARAHLHKCGCGIGFYRPNMVVMVKDEARYSAESDGGKVEATKYFYRTLYVSDYLSLHVPIDPWYVDNPYGMCEGTNALIPNGIASWKLDSLTHKEGKWIANDNLKLQFSVSDFSVDRVDFNGVLNMLLNLKGNSAFLPPPSAKGTTFEHLKVAMPELGPQGELTESLAGVGKKNIECAIESSKKFCAAFAREQEYFKNEKPKVDKAEANKKLKDQITEFQKMYEVEIAQESNKNQQLDNPEEEEEEDY